MENFFVIDVEADLYEQAPYNIGIVIGNQKEIIDKRNIFMLNHMKENEKAMYAAENYAYFENNRKEFKCYDDDLEFTYDFLKLIQDYEIKKAYETGYVKTLFNRKRVIEELNNEAQKAKVKVSMFGRDTVVEVTYVQIEKLN